MARSSGSLWPSDNLLQSVRSLAAGRRQRLGCNRPSPRSRRNAPRAMLALDDQMRDMRGRAINLALVVEGFLKLGRHFDARDVIGLVGRLPRMISEYAPAP